MALVRVMMVAGAQRVMGTLWPLHDRAGQVFAGHFYQAWLREGCNVARAYQIALGRTRQDDLNQKINPNHTLGPYAWAPFLLMGR